MARFTRRVLPPVLAAALCVVAAQPARAAAPAPVWHSDRSRVEFVGSGASGFWRDPTVSVLGGSVALNTDCGGLTRNTVTWAVRMTLFVPGSGNQLRQIAVFSEVGHSATATLPTRTEAEAAGGGTLPDQPTADIRFHAICHNGPLPGGDESHVPNDLVSTVDLDADPLPPPPPPEPSPLVVNDTGDAPDANDADDKCSTAADNEVCTLRAAIQESNARQSDEEGAQTIAFAIDSASPPTIAPATPLPALEGTVALDGTTQTGGWVVLSGAEAPASDGLRFVGSDGELRGFVVNGFSGDGSAGVVLSGDGGHVVTASRIGTDAAGTSAVPNHIGVWIIGSDSRIGAATSDTSACTGECVLVAGNGLDEVRIGGSRSSVVGSFLGVDVTGGSALGDAPRTIHVAAGADGLAIGGTAPAAGQAPGNVIAGSLAIDIRDSDDAVIRGNLIGVSAAGTKFEGGNAGLQLGAGSARATIGGPDPGDRNVVAGFAESNETPPPADGLHVGMSILAAGTLVQGNLVGVGLDGETPVGNGIGIRVGVPGSTDPQPTGVEIRDNIVSGNGSGVVDRGEGTVLTGNRVGTDATGTAAVPNFIGISSANPAGGTRAGTSCASPCNLISGNVDTGLVGGGSGNFIGTDVSGTVALPNGIGVKSTDQPLLGSADAAVVRACLGACNLVSGNADAGVVAGDIIGGQLANPIEPEDVRGNVIGRSITGSPLPNAGPGIAAAAGPMTITGNWIAGNGGAGVLVGQPVGNEPPHGVTITANTVEQNSGVGIDLSNTSSPAGDGPTANDHFEDLDAGPNGLQNKPLDGKARRVGGTLEVLGNFERPSEDLFETFPIDLYAVESCDASGFGEGERFLGTTTDILPNGFWQAILPATSTPAFITATITDEDGSTSEFGPCWPVLRAARMSSATSVGATEVAVASNDGFAVGDLVEIGEGTDHAEQAVVTGFGSLLLDRPLQFEHAVDELIVNLGPATAGPPGNVRNTPGKSSGSITVKWDAAAANGGAITKYRVTCSANNSTVTAKVDGSTRKVVFTNLRKRRTYTCSVAARNANGWGPAATASTGTKPKP